MKRFRGRLLLLALGGLLSSRSSFGASPSSTGGVLFQEPFGARPFALGQAYAALGDDVYAMNYNPASLSRLRESQAAAQFTQSISDVQLGYVGLATPLNPTNAMGLNVEYLSGGNADIFDGSGSQTRTINGERDFLIGLGFAHTFGMAAGKLHMGANGKLLHSAVGQDAQATAYSGDLGTLYEVPWLGGRASAGAAVLNVGPGIRYSGGLASGSQSDPLPLTTSLALGYAHEAFAADGIALGVQVDRVSHENLLFESFGAEYDYHRLCSFRFGYRFGEDAGGLRMGIGLHFKNLSLDYGIGVIQTFNNIQQLSLNYRFTIPGIRYSQNAPPSPLETMVKTVQAAIQAERFFDAAAELGRIEEFFPGAPEARELKARLFHEIETILIHGNMSRRYEYVLGFQQYEEHRWKEAVTQLQIGLRKEPDNAEIKKYLARAQEQSQEQERQFKLQTQARIGTLYELANVAFSDQDYTRALRIVNEILRLGPYQPATELKSRIEVESAKPKMILRPVKPPPAPALRPAEQNASAQPGPSAADLERAEALYYEALRDYADNRIAPAVEKLREGIKLNPANETLKTSLNYMERELNRRGRINVNTEGSP